MIKVSSWNFFYVLTRPWIFDAVIVIGFLILCNLGLGIFDHPLHRPTAFEDCVQRIPLIFVLEVFERCSRFKIVD